MLPAKRSVALSVALLILVFRISGNANTLKDQKDNDARQATARAEGLRATGTEAALRKALEDYDKALSIWTSISDFANASKAALESGDIHFLFSEYAEALKRYKNAETTSS